MEGTVEDVLERVQLQAGSFERMSDKKDERLNDGNNYKGLMDVHAYKKKRQEMALEPEQIMAAKEAAIRGKIQADQNAANKAGHDRAERERAKREALQRELSQPEKSDDPAPTKKKRKKNAAPSSALSFDAEDE